MLSAGSSGEQPTFHGEPADLGRIVIGEQVPNEGYAVLRCGNTEVRISYTVLSGLAIEVSPSSFQMCDMAALQDAIYSIACEASLGRIGD